MKPVILAWLTELGLPSALVPGYATTVGAAALIGAAIVLSTSRRDGADVRVAATAMLLAYGGALGGGYVYEWLRVTPAALAAGSIDPYLHVGRAAYGGLIFASLGAALYLRRRGASVRAFFDRVALAAGVIFALVRFGCFLEGCDFGVPTESLVGVHYPADSLAAIDHAARGWIPAGTPSLPTHPTQLYEGATAVLGSGVAWALRPLIRRGAVPAGAAFGAWLAVYAVGRAAIETLRADPGRGLYLGVSSAQWTSLAIGLAVIAFFVPWRRWTGVPAVGGPREA